MRNLRQGFGVVEIVVVVAMLGIILASVTQAALITSRLAQRSAREAQAVSLAEEAVEAMRTLRNASWTTYISPLTNGTTYYVTLNGTQWSLSTTDPGAIYGQYNRTVVTSAVYRDSGNNISSAGTLDPDTRKVVVTVTWVHRGETRNITLETYLTNYHNN